MELYGLSIYELSELLANRKVTAVEVADDMLGRIEQTDEAVKAYITLDHQGVRLQAEAADRQLANGQAGPLCGIPIAVKDVICTKGIRTTCGSLMLESFVPPYDATVVRRLKEAGAVILGKTSMDEFAMGSSNENCSFGVPRNPWNKDCICGGSSGGAAAAVAADICIGSLGSDTGGSIRQPASHCGVVGLKPTYGRVSRYGLVAFGSSLDQIGPLTKNVTDCAILLNEIAGYDSQDSTSVDRPVPDYTSALGEDLTGMTIGIPKEYFVEGLDVEVREAVLAAIEELRRAGAKTREVSLPHTEYGVAAYYIIAPAEASSNLARFDGVRYGFRDREASSLVDMYRLSRSQGFGPEVKRRIMIGTFALSSGYYDAYYRKASQVRTLIIEDFRRAFSSCDLLVSPVCPMPAWKIGEKVDDPLSMYLSDVLTIPGNLAGLPAVSVPCSFSRSGLPIGLQIQGDYFQEEKLLRTAYSLEKRLGISDRKPRE